MKLTFRAVRLIALALWVGGIVFFLAVASVAFKTMPDAHFAGIIVRGSLLALHRIGLFAGTAYLFFTLALLATHDSHPVRAVEIVLVVSMIALTLYLQQSVLPRMETDRLTLGGNVQGTSPELPAHQNFDRLHALSTRLEGTILFEGLALLCLAPIQNPELHRLS